MFIVREEFTARPGMASKLAKMFKEAVGDLRGYNIRILTDHIGNFNTVVMETEVAELAEFDKLMQEYMTRADIRDRMKGYTDMYMTGRREIYKIM